MRLAELDSLVNEATPETRRLASHLSGKFTACQPGACVARRAIHSSIAANMSDFDPVEILAGNHAGGLLLLADHAMRHLPQEYGRLGLPDGEFERHIAYDIGVEGVMRHLAALLDAPAVMARFSRLLIDPNRGEDDPTLVRQLYDGSVIRANYPLTSEERERRLVKYFRPFRQAVRNCAAACDHACNGSALLVSIHSFTPVMGNRVRPWHVGLLWDRDDRVLQPLKRMLSADPALVVGDNEPYDGALKGDTLHECGTQMGRAHILIEIRQDLIADANGQQAWAERIAPMLSTLNRSAALHQYLMFGSRTD